MVQEGYPMVKETVLGLTDEEFMACYRIIEAECSAQQGIRREPDEARVTLYLDGIPT